MKLIASLLLWISLGLGAIAGTTAYRPTLDAVANAAEPLTLAAPAGIAPRAPDATGDPEPLVRPAAAGASPVRLDAELVARLRSAGVERVRVKEFAFGRWKEAWIFGFACLGLGVAAALIRIDARRSLAQADAHATASGTVRLTPEQALAETHRKLDELRVSIGPRPNEEGLKRLVELLNELQATHMTAFVDDRARLLGTLGMGRYARLMGSFATAERQLNRAWSAAADRVPAEAIDSLNAGIGSLGETIALLRKA